MLAAVPGFAVRGHRERLGPLGARCWGRASSESPCCPSSGGHREWCPRQQVPTSFAEPALPDHVESGDVRTRWSHPEREWLPPVVETRVLDGDPESGLLDRVQSSFSEELCELTLARPGEPRLIVDVAIEFARRVPEAAERSLASMMVPDACGHDASLASHAGHLAQAHDGIFHEVDDQLGQRGIEGLILERELRRGRSSYVDRGISLLRSCDESVGRIDRSDGRRSQALDEFGGQCTRAASDVEHAHCVDDHSEFGKHRREWRGVPAHETVVGIGSNREAHSGGLYAREANGPARKSRSPMPTVVIHGITVAKQFLAVGAARVVAAYRNTLRPPHADRTNDDD